MSHRDYFKPYDYPHDPQFGKASPGKIGMWIFLGTDALSFSGLLIGYAVLRSSKQWPNPAQHLGIDLSAIATFILICSSVSMVMALDHCKRHNRDGMLKWLASTIAGGVAFLVIQVYEYSHLIHKGLTFSHFDGGTDLFASTFYGITGFHGLHVLTGTIYLCVMYKFAYEGKFDKGNSNLLEIAGLFWHFVDLVWILVFTFIYLL